MKKTILFLFVLALSGASAKANGPLRKMTKDLSSESDEIFYQDQGVETDFSTFDYLSVKQKASITSADIEMIVPKSLHPGSEGYVIEGQIRRHFIGNLAKSSFIQNIGFLKSVTQAAKSLDDATQFGHEKKEKSENETPSRQSRKIAVKSQQPKKQDIDHKIKFKLQALKAEAKLTYSGFVDSTLIYFGGNNSLVLTADKKLTTRSKIRLMHTADNQGNTQTLNYNFNW